VNSDELLAFARALPPNVTRIKFHDPQSGAIEIEQLPLPPTAPPVGAPRDPLTADEIQAAYDARRAAEKPSDVASLAQATPEFRGDE
jgi:hypothetical protein